MRRTGTPRASATIGSTVAKVSGRYMIPRPTIVITATATRRIRSARLTAVMAPNRIAKASDA